MFLKINRYCSEGPNGYAQGVLIRNAQKRACANLFVLSGGRGVNFLKKQYCPNHIVIAKRGDHLLGAFHFSIRLLLLAVNRRAYKKRTFFKRNETQKDERSALSAFDSWSCMSSPRANISTRIIHYIKGLHGK